MEPPKVLQQGGAPGQLAKGGENAEEEKTKKYKNVGIFPKNWMNLTLLNDLN